MSTGYDFGIKIDGETGEKDWNRSDQTALRRAYGDPDSYERDVKGTLDIIQQNLAGKVLLNLLAARAAGAYAPDWAQRWAPAFGKHLTIVPFTDHDSVNLKVRGDIDDDNAFSRADDGPDSHPKDQPWYPHSEQQPGGGSMLDTSDDVGTGEGSNATIHFTPRHFGNACGPKSSCDRGGLYGRYPEEVLFHEMVHAFRQVSGRDLGRPSGDRYDNEEEFLAIVVTNVFISAFGRNDSLRAGHESFAPLLYPQNTSQGFLDNPDNMERLTRYYNEELELYQKLYLIPDDAAHFNPFRQFVKNGV
jgi:hypothetical protein